MMMMMIIIIIIIIIIKFNVSIVEKNLPNILICNFCLSLSSRVAVGVARKVNRTPQTRKRNYWKMNGD
jgi:hypothetical protein